MDIEQSLKSVRDVYISYPKRYDLATDELRHVENEIQDILHVIELVSLDAIQMTKKYKELKHLRQVRRGLKEELEILEEIKTFVAHPKPTEKNIGQAVGKVRSTIERQKKRTYGMRVRKDWQELIK